ncbi:hypothetical protein H0H93_008406 [Arthromyces matolae]|nr:hypothetical protein H0H93_008406 [Arthromyces matolae]
MDIGRRVGDWGKEIIKGGYGSPASSGASRGGLTRGRGGSGRGRGRGRGKFGGNTKRDILKMQLEARDIDMDVLPTGMERRKINQSYWDPKSHAAFLTIEFKIYPPRDPITPSSQSPDPPLILLTHRNSTKTSLLDLAQQAAERALSKKEGATHGWLRRFLFPDPDEPGLFTPPHFVMAITMDPRLAVLQRSKSAGAHCRFDPAKSLLDVLRDTHFVEFPTIEVWEEFNGTVVDLQGILKELPADEESRSKRRKLSVKQGKRTISGLLGGYGSDESGEEPEAPNGLEMLGGYTGSDDEGGDIGSEVEGGGDEDALMGSDEEGDVEIDPAVLLELMRHVHGEERWSEKIKEDEDVEDVDWGASEDEVPI